MRHVGCPAMEAACLLPLPPRERVCVCCYKIYVMPSIACLEGQVPVCSLSSPCLQPSFLPESLPWKQPVPGKKVLPTQPRLAGMPLCQSLSVYHLGSAPYYTG